MPSFQEKLYANAQEGKFVCVGLDPDPEKFPTPYDNETPQHIFPFLKDIVDATKDIAGAFKPNIAHFEAWEEHGAVPLRQICWYIAEVAPKAVLILDAKRGDVKTTNVFYARAAFDRLRVDAITLHAYPGKQSMQPFLDRKDKGCIFLAKTSDQGSGEFQDLRVVFDPNSARGSRKMYEHIADTVSSKWNDNYNCGLVVGATYPSELERARYLAPTLPILIPGFGAQGGNLERSVEAGLTMKHDGIICNSSRGILYASRKDDFRDAARAAALAFDADIRRVIFS